MRTGLAEVHFAAARLKVDLPSHNRLAYNRAHRRSAVFRPPTAAHCLLDAFSSSVRRFSLTVPTPFFTAFRSLSAFSMPASSVHCLSTAFHCRFPLPFSRRRRARAGQAGRQGDWPPCTSCMSNEESSALQPLTAPSSHCNCTALTRAQLHSACASSPRRHL